MNENPQETKHQLVVRGAFLEITKEPFDAIDIANYIREDNRHPEIPPVDYIADKLKQFHEQGDSEVVQEGSSHESTKYKRTFEPTV